MILPEFTADTVGDILTRFDKSIEEFCGMVQVVAESQQLADVALEIDRLSQQVHLLLQAMPFDRRRSKFLTKMRRFTVSADQWLSIQHQHDSEGSSSLTNIRASTELVARRLRCLLNSGDRLQVDADVDYRREH